ncbi:MULTISPECIES: hypothetical protein [Lysobacter]|uniref:hypothetical protein n=1 Tax=Lysobacter TaxID=68 RepID=UPI001F20E756|nr:MULTISPECIES: hypothetical protein [Lysobacter]UJB18560.1 hypothetical protein L1A79_19840 [Lysobacter capsici]UJQ27715.1 hypothetical protein L2D09_20045 [Lysobacter gummosus]
MDATAMRRLMLVLVLLVGLSACQKEQPSVPSQTKPAVKIVELKVGQMAVEGSPVDGPQQADKPIVVTVQITGEASSAILEAKLIELKTGRSAGLQTVTFSKSIPSEHSFVFKRESVWPEGRYLVEVKLNGKLAAQQDVDVMSVNAGTAR